MAIASIAIMASSHCPCVVHQLTIQYFRHLLSIQRTRFPKKDISAEFPI